MNVLRRKKQRNQIRGILGTVGAAILLFVGIGYFVQRYASIEELDPITHCPTSGHSAHFVVLLDTTDPLSRLQAQEIERELDNILNDMGQHDRISMFALSEDFDSAVIPEISLCNPGSGSEASFLDQNPERIQQIYVNDFQRPLLSITEKFIHAKPQSRSPIFEMLRTVTVSAFSQDRDKPNNKRLYVFSDMIQNSAEFSRYRQPPDFNKLKDTRYCKTLITNMSGVEVYIRYISRNDIVEMQSPRDLQFWEQYILEMGGRVKSIKWIDR